MGRAPTVNANTTIVSNATYPVPPVPPSASTESTVVSEDVNRHFGTLAVHAGSTPDPATGAVIPPISLSTTFKQSAVGVHSGYEYSRSGNPNRDAFETAVAALEHGKYGIAFSSGSATTATIISTLPVNSHIVSVNDVYGGTYRYFTKVAPKLSVETTFTDLVDPEALISALQPNTRLVWLETPTNPTLRLVDIRRIAEITHSHNAILVVDNTFLSSYFQTPLDLGADIVVHSGTKYLNGHSDVVIGIAVTNDQGISNALRFMQNAGGPVPSAFDCFLALRGLKTLHLRMQQHERNAHTLAHALQSSPYVTSVIYPGLESHPQHKLAKRQQRGYGGMISFRIRGTLDTANRFLQNTRLFTLAESLGGVESLCELPALMTHSSVSPEDRLKLGITDTLIRLSVGIEDTRDLVEDVEQALVKAVGGDEVGMTKKEAVKLNGVV